MERFNLGAHTRPVTTTSTTAQRLFNLGLNWCFGFNQEEGAACFREVLIHDPACAMAHWGIAYAQGPFYNMPWVQFSPDEAITCTALCHHHISRAQELMEGCTEAEKGLITALALRFQASEPVAQEEFDRWDDDYAAAMRAVAAQYPDDLDVQALAVEAMITRTPWKLWDVQTGAPADDADTVEALGMCNRAMADCRASDRPQHPAILHLHIHLTEMSNTPEASMEAADMLGVLCPDAGHMNHMPGHTYVLCGDYERAKLASEKAVAADDLYLDYAGPYNFYTTARCHDLHLMMYACMLMGQFAPAWAAAEKMRATLTPEVLKVPHAPHLARTLEGYYSTNMHVLVRFGRWEDILKVKPPNDPLLYCVSTAMHHYARGVAYAALKRFEEAEEEQQLFFAAWERVPQSRVFFNNSARVTLGVAEKMLEGELNYHQGNYDIAFAALREAVARDDALEYTEPWAWMHPPRHALAALLLEQGHVAEAEAAYRQDLGLCGRLQRCAQHPRNVWALHGIVECLRRGDDAGAELPELEAQLAEAMALTDVPIRASCLCRGMA